MDFEKLGELYLGRPYDVANGKVQDGYVLYDARDLTTHAMIVGMTGSGKTGLGIALLEEAAIDGVPAIAIDPKGDLANLALTFPTLSAEEFRPWIDESEASRAGLTPDAFAASQAELWKKGLAASGQGPDRIKRLRAAADVVVFTPGSTAGRPLSILKALSPPPGILEDRELVSARVTATASSLLALLGVEADPLRSREHILLSTILTQAWQAGETIELDTLVRRIQTPPFTRLGALDLEAIYPAKDRLQLSVQLNGLIASPGAAQWVEGEPLNVDRLLHDETGKPRISVISIAHLGDAERAFFVALLLQEVVGWMRAQEGTGSLRAILYMDEVAGYLPPVANPPSKAGFLLLLKQARAFGLGLVLATQNPVDLDYKALSNIGTWLLGRLQTERDKARVLDGLEAAAAGAALSRGEIDRLLSALGKRVFFLHNVKHDAPVVFETRWTMSYLRGPLTREQLRRLSVSAPQAAPAGGPEVRAAPATAARVASPPIGGATTPPVLPTGVTQAFAPPAPGAPSPLAYLPRLYLAATVRFVDAKRGIDATRSVWRFAPFAEGVSSADWPSSEVTDLAPGDLETEPRSPAVFGSLPPGATSPKAYAAFSKDFARYLSMTEVCALLTCPALGESSKPGEDERAFRVRLQQKAREQRDAEKDKLQQRYAPKLATLTGQLKRAQDAEAREAQQASQQKLQTALSFGATLLGAVFGNKTVSASNISKAVTAARGVGRSMKEAEDVKRAGARAESVAEDYKALEDEFQQEVNALESKWDAMTLALEPFELKPKKTDVLVQQALLVWVPASAS